MTLDKLNTIAALGTFAVIAATAIAAVIQLRHLRRSNWLTVQLKIVEMWNSPGIQEPYDYIKMTLPKALEDPVYRADLEYGPIDRKVHREMAMLDWNAHLGLMLQQGAIDETFLALYWPAVRQSWERLMPVLAVTRRRRGAHFAEQFDYLVARLHAMEAQPRKDMFAGLKRPPVVDDWLSIDHPPSDADAPADRF